MADFIALPVDWTNCTEGLCDAEKGRLIDAVAAYINGEDWQNLIKGNERFVFNVLKGQITRYLATCETNKANGSKGGRPRKTGGFDVKTGGFEMETGGFETETGGFEDKLNHTIYTNNTLYTSNTDQEEDKENIISKRECDSKGGAGGNARRARFTPPTPQEVAVYCSEQGYRVDAERFVAYYESNGWRVGRNPMKDWRAAVRTWVRNDAGGSAPRPFGNRHDLTQPDPRIAALEELKRKFEAEEGGS